MVSKGNLSSPNSGLLMPPPSFVPAGNKCEIVPTKKVDTNCDPVLLDDKDRIFDSLINNSTGTKVKRVHCSVPKTDVICYTNGDIAGSVHTKTLLRQQIHNKVYRKLPMFEHLKVAPKLGVEQLNNEVITHFTSMKRDEDHFKDKVMKIEHVDISRMGLPLRCSTPTPSIDGFTVVAGHEGKDEDDMSIESNDSDEWLTQLLVPFINKRSKKKTFMNKEEEKEKELPMKKENEDYFGESEGQIEVKEETMADTIEIKEEKEETEIRRRSEVQNEFEDEDEDMTEFNYRDDVDKSVGNMTLCRDWVQHSGNTNVPPPSKVSVPNNGDFGNTTLNITSVSHACPPKNWNQTIGRGVESVKSESKPIPMFV